MDSDEEDLAEIQDDGDGDMESAISSADETPEGSEKQFKCDKCDMSYSYKASLYTHKRTHDDNIHACSICGKKFALKKYLSRHIKCHYTVSDNLCQICGKMYKSAHSLKVHRDTKHGVDTRYKCHKCDRTLSCARRFREHVQSHDETTHECDCCKKSFHTTAGLLQHLKRGSCKTVPSKFACTKCQKTFASKRYLRQHQTTHGPSKFVCPVCGKDFKWKLSLKAHTKSCSL